MDSNERREQIKSILSCSKSAVSAGRLSERLGVSRQIIVGDVALLRASGCKIDATPRGYVLRAEDKLPVSADRAVIVSRHDSRRTEEELNILVDNGCKVIDVTVEHPVYGQLTGLLEIASRYDVRNFMSKIAKAGVHSLCELTDGVHIHTIEYTDEDAYKRALSELDAAGFLYKESRES